ncbi:10819_t:CDS:2, partial [Funneliformis geosporum]
SHYLQKLVNHNHSPQTTDGNVANAIAHIKKQAKETRELSVQIIQSNITTIFEKVSTYMPTQNALHARIKHVRKAEMLSESQSLDGIDIQDSLQYTLIGNPEILINVILKVSGFRTFQDIILDSF